jgi:hypothetical protein
MASLSHCVINLLSLPSPRLFIWCLGADGHTLHIGISGVWALSLKPWFQFQSHLPNGKGPNSWAAPHEWWTVPVHPEHLGKSQKRLQSPAGLTQRACPRALSPLPTVTKTVAVTKMVAEGKLWSQRENKGVSVVTGEQRSLDRVATGEQMSHLCLWEEAMGAPKKKVQHSPTRQEGGTQRTEENPQNCLRWEKT